MGIIESHWDSSSQQRRDIVKVDQLGLTVNFFRPVVGSTNFLVLTGPKLDLKNNQRPVQTDNLDFKSYNGLQIQRKVTRIEFIDFSLDFHRISLFFHLKSSEKPIFSGSLIFLGVVPLQSLLNVN